MNLKRIRQRFVDSVIQNQSHGIGYMQIRNPNPFALHYLDHHTPIPPHRLNSLHHRPRLTYPASHPFAQSRRYVLGEGDTVGDCSSLFGWTLLRASLKLSSIVTRFLAGFRCLATLKVSKEISNSVSGPNPNRFQLGP